MFKIIIADDEPHIRTGLSTIVDWEAHGFVLVGQASDGMEALELVEATNAHTVITDIRMPRLNGLELCATLKRCHPGVRVLILSGFNDFAYAKEAMKYGAAGYLLKPIDPEEISRELQNIHDDLSGEAKEAFRRREQEESQRSLFLMKLLRGDVYRDALAEAQAQGIELGQASGGCAVLLVDLIGYGDYLLTLSGLDIELKKFAVRNVLEEIVWGRGLGYLVELSERQYAVVLAPTGRADIKQNIQLVEHARIPVIPPETKVMGELPDNDQWTFLHCQP